jgi:serine/threonine-protein kinase
MGADTAGAPGKQEQRAEDDQRTPALPRAGFEPPSLDTPELPSDFQPPPLTGRKLGQYAILEKIGQGGMGTVFKAFDTALERTVALKVLFSSPVDDPKLAERFLREARSLARLSHPSLLHVYNVGREGDCYYFTMQLLEGETLSAALRRRRCIPAAEFLPYLGQILSALHHVHQQGITHRDIKSGNIMLCGRRAVLMDFGLAKDESFTGLTSVGAVLGTPDYMPPEAAQGAPAGPATDIYSVGVVLYEALSGRLPFLGRSAMSIIRQHIEDAPPRLDKIMRDADLQLCAIIHKCLVKKPAERYPHCPALAVDLARVLQTPELAALAAEPAPVPTRPSLKRTADLQALRVSSAETMPAWPAGQPPLEATVVDAAHTRPQPEAAALGSLDATVPSAQAAPSLPPNGDTAPTVPTAPEPQQVAAAPARKTAHWRAWAWMAAGFFGVLFLVAFLANLKPGGAPRPLSPPPGQPALLRKADGSREEIRWIEFKAGDADPSKWRHIIARRQPDGTWKQTAVPHRDFVQGNETLEFLPVPGASGSKKP